MVKSLSTYEADAKAAADRITAARDAGDQLTFLPDEPRPGSGAAKRGEGKATSQLRKYLSAQGLRMPEDVLIQMAGLASSEDAFLAAMARTEQVLLWAEAGGRDVVQVIKDGVLIEKELDNRHTTAQRLATFQFVFTAMLRAAEALMPYGLSKVTADVQVTQAVQIVMPAAQGAARGPETARDVTPQARRMGPPPMPTQTQRNQQVSEADTAGRVGEARTE